MMPLPDSDVLIRDRCSVRAFLPREPDRETLMAVLELAARAPSGTNIQPWRVHVLTGAARQTLITRVGAAIDGNLPKAPEYDYYPTEFFEPYLARRRKLGWDLYSLLGIQKTDRAGMAAQHRKNFEFFGAPVGLMFSIDRRMGRGSWLDYGMFLQNLMLAARVHGLDTCPQAAWNDYHAVIAEVLGLTASEQLVCGMALGYADASATVNQLETERAGVDEFAVFHAG